MTHDELLSTIDWIGKTKDGESGTVSALGVATLASLNALRAVVELHKPVKDEWIDYTTCCACRVDGDDYYSPEYPCLTIQVIEKELE